MAPGGIEPPHTDSKSVALSTELRGLGVRVDEVRPTKRRRIRQKRTAMSGLTPHLAVLAAVTTGIGMAMVRLGASRGRLEMRRVLRRCPACGRALQTAVCEACSR